MAENGHQQDSHNIDIPTTDGQPQSIKSKANVASSTGRTTADGAQGIKHTVELQHPPHWQLHTTHGVFPNLHATHARYHDPELDTSFSWTSRRHRKGRRVEVHEVPDKHKVVRRFPRLWGFEWGNISWWVAQFFTWGSVVWCVNGWYALFPLADATTNANIIGWTALVGGTLFEAGAYCMVVEAVNRGNAVRFGYEVKNLMEAGLTRFHRAKGGGHYSLGSPAAGQVPATKYDDQRRLGAGISAASGQANGSRAGSSAAEGKVVKDDWQWWGYRWHSLGYWGSYITFIGASTFWIPTIVGTPNCLPPAPTHVVLWDVLYWLPQVLGSCCFITGALLFMLETQPSWWRIQPFNAGWHVGFWNLVGGVGFWLSGFFGFYSYPAQRYQVYGTALSTFWGSWAFLLGSYIQLVETLN